MKTLFYFALLATLPFTSSFGNNYSSFNLNGLWENVYTSQTVHIKKTRKGLKMRSNRWGSWQRFDKVGYGLYDDCYGTTIRLLNDYTLIVKSKHRHRRSKFVKRGYRQYNNSGYGNGYGQYNGYNDYGYNNGYGNSGYGYSGYSAKQARKKIKGSWINRNNTVKLKIKSTDNGIKVKRVYYGGDWYYYTQDAYQSNRFVDYDGNAYVLLNDYELVFEDRRRGKQLRFRKD